MKEMTDLEIAKSNLSGHSICLCKDGEYLQSDLRGISPIMKLISEQRDLSDYCVADLVVGKAAALLFVRCGIKQVHAKTLSQSAKRVLEEYGIYYEYETLTERIINRAGTDTCPMEKAVWNTEDADEAYTILKKQLSLWQSNKKIHSHSGWIFLWCARKEHEVRRNSDCCVANRVRGSPRRAKKEKTLVL